MPYLPNRGPCQCPKSPARTTWAFEAVCRGLRIVGVSEVICTTAALTRSGLHGFRMTDEPVLLEHGVLTGTRLSLRHLPHLRSAGSCTRFHG